MPLSRVTSMDERVVKSSEPVASVIIPTRDRKDELVQVLDSVLKQNVPLEILVMDDASTDGTVELIRERYPQVRIEPGEQAMGPTYRRNRGAELARTNYLVTLDDDCQLTSPDTVARTLRDFDHERIGAVTLPFINIRFDSRVESAAPDAEHCYITGRFLGGMIAFRRDVYQSIGGYRETFFMHVEESDLAIRMLAAGYVIRLGSAQPLHHLASPIRNRNRVRALGPRNQVLFAWHNVPMLYLPAYLLSTTFKGLRHGWRQGHVLASATGFARGYANILRQPNARHPVPLALYRLHRKLAGDRAVTMEEVEREIAKVNGDE